MSASAQPLSHVLRMEQGSSYDGDRAVLEQAIITQLRRCYDPEIPVNIYELGLIYDIDLQDDGVVEVNMTLTSPMCPVAESLPPEVQARVSSVDGVTACRVNLVWEPTWTPEMMSETAKLDLNMY